MSHSIRDDSFFYIKAPKIIDDHYHKFERVIGFKIFTLITTYCIACRNVSYNSYDH